MKETIKKLEKLLKSLKLYTILSILALIIISCYPTSALILYLIDIIDKPKSGNTILAVIFFLLFLIIFVPIHILNSIWNKEAKKIILTELSSNIDVIEQNTKINIKYSHIKKESKNINENLLKFINEILLLNTINKDKALYYLSNGYSRNISINLEDELIIDLQDPELNNLNFESIEVFLKDIYSKTESYRKTGGEINKREITQEIINFKGIILSTKLNINNNNKNNENVSNSIIIYKKNLFIDPENISFFKRKENNFLYSFIPSVFNFNQLVNHKELNFTINELPIINIEDNIKITNKDNNFEINVYILHPKDQDINSFSKIALKIAEKLYINNNFYKSFAVIFNDTIYLFLNHKDNVLKTSNIFEIPSYLFLKIETLEDILQNFKNQLETILKLVL
ncbi:MAG: hypothetical protein ACP5O4_02475 [bacterium]